MGRYTEWLTKNEEKLKQTTKKEKEQSTSRNPHVKSKRKDFECIPNVWEDIFL
jgi:hypothetical protein